MAISVKNVSKIYGAQKALNQVSFEVSRGEIIGFLGPNGAGKSTMMKILTGYIPQSAGTAKVTGIDLEEDSLAARRNIGYLPEHNPLYLEMYVREFLAMAAGLHGVAKIKIDEIIEKVGLSPERHKRLGELSKGYRQRAGLAAALLHDPEVLILDEPTTGLDPNQIVEIRELIRETGKEKTVMLSTHIMQEVEMLCDRVIIINKGEIVADRPTSDLKKIQEDSLYLVEFDQEINAEKLAEIEGVNQVNALGNKRWEISADRDVRGAIFDFAVAEGAQVLETKTREQNLEQVFQSLTQEK